MDGDESFSTVHWEVSGAITNTADSTSLFMIMLSTYSTRATSLHKKAVSQLFEYHPAFSEWNSAHNLLVGEFPFDEK
jgi:hypothetical protein